mgnify:FL=1
MQEHIPLGTDLDILNEIGKWKVIPLKGLYQSLKEPMIYNGFCKRVQILERVGLVRGFTKNKSKYVVLTLKGSTVSKFSNYYDENEDSLNHDLTAALVLRRILEFENFKSGEIFNADYMDISPDATIYAKRGGREYTLALELELSQKNRNRVTGKFSKYAHSQAINHVLYVFNKQNIFESYNRILSEMNDLVQGKIILCCDTGLSLKGFNYVESQCWHRQTAKTFNQIFK